MSDVLIYHYPCPDGVFAGLAAYLRLAHDGRTVRVAPQVSYRSPSERASGVDSSIATDDTVHLLDFSGGVEFILALCARAKSVQIADHHKTAQEDIHALMFSERLPANFTVHIDMTRSGATMARDVYNVHPVLKARLGDDGAARVLRLFDYIEDNDLWRHVLPGSKAFSAGLAARAIEYDATKNASVWDTLLGLDVDTLIAEGEAVLEEQRRVVASEVALSFPVHIPFNGAPTGGGLRCLAIVSTHPDLRSDLGNELAKKSAAAGLQAAGVVAYVEPGMGAAAETTYKVSLRSIGDVDTSALSKSYGGGGHANASSFNAAMVTFSTWVVQ